MVLQYFSKSPKVHFYVDFASYVVLVCLYTYMVLTPMASTPSPVEYVVFAWFVALVADEIRQVRFSFFFSLLFFFFPFLSPFTSL